MSIIKEKKKKKKNRIDNFGQEKGRREELRKRKDRPMPFCITIEVVNG